MAEAKILLRSEAAVGAGDTAEVERKLTALELMWNDGFVRYLTAAGHRVVDARVSAARDPMQQVAEVRHQIRTSLGQRAQVVADGQGCRRSWSLRRPLRR